MITRHDALLDPVSGVHDLIDGYRKTQVVCTAARLGLPDLLAAGPLLLEELAVECAVSPADLGRLMQALTALDVCTVGPEGYRTTELGRALESTAPGGAYQRALATAEHLYPLWADLADLLCRGDAAAPAGVPDPAADDGEHGRHTDEVRRIATEIEMPPDAVLVDVGGQAGPLFTELLRARPDRRGVLYGPPGSTGRARTAVAAAGLGERTVVVEGDLPDHPTASGDVYVLASLLHRRDDGSAVELLRAVGTAMRPRARLLLAEHLLPAGPRGVPGADGLHDLNVLVTTGGRDRTEGEYVALLSAAGLRHVGTRCAGGTLGVLEARV